MAQGLLHLHNALRWVILIFLLVSIFQAITKNKGLVKSSLFLLIAAHLTLVLGVYQWFTSSTVGLSILERMDNNFGLVMKDAFARFWVVEHFAGMLVAIIFITIARRKAKLLQYKPALILYVIALILIIAVIPWPFRAGIGRPWLPGM